MDNAESDEDVEEDRQDYSGIALRLSEVNYKLRFKRIHIDPIVESNKNPHPGSAAAVSSLFDIFFAIAIQ